MYAVVGSYTFELVGFYIVVSWHNEIVGRIHCLDDNGHCSIKTQEQLEMQADFWLAENVSQV